MKGIQCKRCFFFTPEWCPKKRDSLDPDLIRDCQYFRTKTNADRIRSMTDEELEYEFWRIYRELPNWSSSTEWLHQWLKAEVEE